MKEDIKNEIREVGKKMDKISLKEVIKVKREWKEEKEEMKKWMEKIKKKVKKWTSTLKNGVTGRKH